MMMTDLNRVAAAWRQGALLLALLLGMSAGWAQADSQRREPENQNAANAAIPPTTDTLRPVERAFIDQARTLLREQRRLGELGVGNAAKSEVRSHAQQIAADSRRLTEAIDGLVRKKGIAVTTAAETPSDAYQAISGKTGPDFDRMLVLKLMELHESTSALFESATAEAKDADIRELASAQLPMLRDHRNRIVRLRALFD